MTGGGLLEVLFIGLNVYVILCKTFELTISSLKEKGTSDSLTRSTKFYIYNASYHVSAELRRVANI
jgi:hypothetical protein